MFASLIEKLGMNKTAVLTITLFIFVVFSFGFIFSPQSAPVVYFLDVGQGDSELVLLPGGVEILIDGGLPNGRALEEISRILPFTDRYIDLVIMSHPELDHFGGLIEVMERYKVGAFLYNGRKGKSAVLGELEKKINENGIKHIVLEKGDRIIYKDSVIKVLSPERDEYPNNTNNASLVLGMNTENTNFLFTGDIDKSVEKNLIGDLKEVDVLKVAHHGSKYSSSNEFLNVVNPKVSVIEVGKNNYGHPSKEVIRKLETIDSQIYRTDLNGTIKILPKDDFLQIFTSK